MRQGSFFRTALLLAAVFCLLAGGPARAVDAEGEARARNGSVEAMVEIGEAYLRRGGLDNLKEAYAWLHLAEEWEGLPQYLFGRDRDALRRLRANGGEAAVREAEALYQERWEAVMAAIGRAPRDPAAAGAAPVGLRPAADDVRAKVGRLVLTYRGGEARGCTATLVDENHLLTAAHCLEDEISGDKAMAAYFLPGYDGSIADQQVAAIADLAVWDTRWKEFKDVPDVAVLRLSNGDGGRPVTVATRGILPFDAPASPIRDKKVRLIGYPFERSDTPGAVPTERLVDRVCKVSDSPDGRVLSSMELCEMAQGASGGPVLDWDPEASRVEVVGVTSYILPDKRQAVFARLTPAVADRIDRWIADPGSDPGRSKVERSLMSRPIYWLTVENRCDQPVRASVLGRPYDRNELETYTAMIPPRSIGIAAGPLSEAQPKVNLTGAETGEVVFSGDSRYSIGGREVAVGAVGGPNPGYGRIVVEAVCSG